MYAQPDYTAALASLQSMTSDQLKEILNSDDKFDEFIKELPQMKAMYSEKEMVMASNKSLAEYNLSQEPVLREAKERLLEKYGEATRLSEEVRGLQAELERKSGSVRPDPLLALLEAANQEAEEESEIMMDSYIQSGDRSIEQFIEEYQEKRKLAHMRRIKVDKMKELLARKQSATPSRQAPPPPGGYGGGGGNPLPYPSQAFNNMPLPGYR